MTMKEQIIVLKVAFDDTETDEPSGWSWPTVLGCLPEHVTVLAGGSIEDAPDDMPELADADDDDDGVLRDAIMHDAQVMAGWGQGVVFVGIEEPEEDESCDTSD